jgi:hypothetical protein
MSKLETAFTEVFQNMDGLLTRVAAELKLKPNYVRQTFKRELDDLFEGCVGISTYEQKLELLAGFYISKVAGKDDVEDLQPLLAEAQAQQGNICDRIYTLIVEDAIKRVAT